MTNENLLCEWFFFSKDFILLLSKSMKQLNFKVFPSDIVEDHDYSRINPVQ